MYGNPTNRFTARGQVINYICGLSNPESRTVKISDNSIKHRGGVPLAIATGTPMLSGLYSLLLFPITHLNIFIWLTHAPCNASLIGHRRGGISVYNCIDPCVPVEIWQELLYVSC